MVIHRSARSVMSVVLSAFALAITVAGCAPEGATDELEAPEEAEEDVAQSQAALSNAEAVKLNWFGRISFGYSSSSSWEQPEVVGRRYARENATLQCKEAGRKRVGFKVNKLEVVKLSSCFTPNCATHLVTVLFAFACR
jgi:hypothetical protein